MQAADIFPYLEEVMAAYRSSSVLLVLSVCSSFSLTSTPHSCSESCFVTVVIAHCWKLDFLIDLRSWICAEHCHSQQLTVQAPSGSKQ